MKLEMKQRNMPTTVNDVSTSSSSFRRHSSLQDRHDEKSLKTDFLYRIKYTNALPDIPFDTKFLACPFVSLNRFVDYKPSSLEKNFKFELLAEADLGIEIDLINPDTYYIDNDADKKQHHPTDLELLEDEQANPQNIRRSQQHSKMVPWMRKTEYISSEFTRFGVAVERQETKIGYSTRKKLHNEILYRDRASQIAAINKTFDDVANHATEHPSRKGVTAVAEFPLLPDFENWSHPFALVIFDGDPIPKDEKTNSQELIGMMDEEGEQFFCVFLNGFEHDNYLFSFRGGGVFYNELETKVSLTRRKAKRFRVSFIWFLELILNVQYARC
ncbi:unnamed protein product [Dracunculus medinensis]|uniref:RNA polymerase II-associated factor 1 homolog n=1 Tax=Dracunculus medinensis TaxID=318479 RepID=A0A0N4U1T1_DRAME|nr:unnamed protein product [Dracunculus medinensis]